MQQQEWLDYVVQTRWNDHRVAVRSRHTFLEVFDEDAKRTSTETLYRSSSEPRSIGRSIVNHEPMRQSPGQVLSNEHGSSNPGPETEAAARLLLRWPITQAAKVDEVSSDKDVNDSDVDSVDACTSDRSVSSGMFVTGKQRRRKARPCKGRRERYRKLVTRLVEQHKNAPGGFDIAGVQLPPSISTPDELAKLDQKVQGRLDKERGRKLEDSESVPMSVPLAYARRTSTERLHRSSSEQRSIGRSVVNHEPVRQSPGQVLSSEHECSGPGPEPEVAVRWPTRQAAQVDEVSSDKDVNDSDAVPADTYSSNRSVSSGTFVTGKQRQRKLNPCKGRRARYRKLVTRLVEQHKHAPGGFDIANVRLLPSISAPDELAKLDQRVRGRLKKERGMQLEDSESVPMSAPQEFFARGSDAASSGDALPVSFAMVPRRQLAHARGLMSHGSEAPAVERGNANFEQFKVVRGSFGRQGAQSGEGHRDMPTDGGKQQPSRGTHGELLYHQGKEIEGLTEGQAWFQRARQHADPGMQHCEGEHVPFQGRDRTVISLSNSLSRDRSAAPHGYDMEGDSSLRPPISRSPLQLAGHAALSSFQALAATEYYGAQADFSAAPHVFKTSPSSYSFWRSVHPR